MDTGSSEQLRPRDRPIGEAKGEQLLRLAAIGLMTPGITHDVNNMLQSVGSVLQMIDRRIDHGSLEELATLTADGLQAIDRATTLSKRLMAFSRPGAFVQSRTEVNALLRDLKPLLQWVLAPRELGNGRHLRLRGADNPVGKNHLVPPTPPGDRTRRRPLGS